MPTREDVLNSFRQGKRQQAIDAFKAVSQPTPEQEGKGILKQLEESIATAVTSFAYDIPGVKTILNATDLQYFKDLQGRIQAGQAEYPQSAALGKAGAFTAELGATAASLPLAITTVAANAVDQAMTEKAPDEDATDTVKRAVYKVSKDLTTLGGLQLGLGGASKFLEKIGTTEQYRKLAKRLSGLSKRVQQGKISEVKANAAADEIIANIPAVPGVRQFNKKISAQVENVNNELDAIYSRAAKATNNSPVVDLTPISERLRVKATAIGQEGDIVLSKDLNRLADDFENVILPNQPAVGIDKGRTIVQKLRKGTFTKDQQLSKEAKEIAAKTVRDEMNVAITKNAPEGGELVQGLQQTNEKAHNLLNASLPLSKEAAKKSNSLLPDYTEMFLFGLGQVAPISSAVAAVRYAGRVGQNVGPGLAIKGLQTAPAAARFARGAATPIALTAQQLEE